MKFTGNSVLKIGKSLLKFGGIIGKFLGSSFLKIIKVIKMVGLALKAAFVANPVGLIIVAIVAVIAIFVLLYKKCEWFRKGVDKAWKAIKEGFKDTWTWIKNKFHALMELGVKVWAKIKEYKALFIPFIGIFVVLYQKCEWFRNGVNAIWKAIKNAFTNTWQWIKDKFNALLEIGSNAWNGLKSSATAIIDKIREAFSGFFDWLHNKWEDLKSLGSKLNPFNWFKRDEKVAQNYSGTNYFGGGLTTLAERGAELVEMNNSSYLVNSPTMANLPRGARILNNSQTRSSLSSRVSSLKDRIRNISNNSKTIIGGDTITINITGNSSNQVDIAREVKKVMLEIQNKKRRTAIV